MNATIVATAGVQPGSTARVLTLAARIEKLRDLQLIDSLVNQLAARGTSARALELHRATRDRLRAELGLL